MKPPNESLRMHNSRVNGKLKNDTIDRHSADSQFLTREFAHAQWTSYSDEWVFHLVGLLVASVVNFQACAVNAVN